MKKRAIAFLLGFCLLMALLVPGTLASEPEIPGIPDTPDTPETPATPDVPEVPDTPVIPDVPEVPDTPVMPDVPEVPDTPVIPDVPEVPDTPVTPDVPEVPDAPQEPEVPQNTLEPDIFTRLMSAADLREIESIAAEGLEVLQNLTMAEIIALYERVDELYENLCEQLLLVGAEPAEEDTQRWLLLKDLLAKLPNAPYCQLCGFFNGHEENCPVIAPKCNCQTGDGVHGIGCPYYVAPECTCSAAEGVHAESCCLYVPPQCICQTGDGIHGAGCPLYAGFTVTFLAPFEGQEKSMVEYTTAQGYLVLPDASAVEGFAPADSTGKVFYGWTETEGQINSELAAGREILVNRDMTLYALWIDASYPVYYYAQGAAISQNAPLSYSYSALPAAIELPVPEIWGCDFAGWKVSGEGNWAEQICAGVLDITGKYGAVTLIAQWKEQEICIYYAAGEGGAVSTEAEKLPLESGFAQGSVAYASEGYAFEGWYNSRGERVCDTESFIPGKTLLPADTVLPYFGNEGTQTAHTHSINVAETYTARFSRLPTSLTIYTGEAGEGTVFSVSGPDCSTVAATGKNGMVSVGGLQVGASYTVTVLGGGNWRCSIEPSGAQITLSDKPEENMVIFTPRLISDKWISAESCIVG